jgi:hypothetical protein
LDDLGDAGACAFAVIAASAAHAQSDEATALTNRMHELVRAGRIVEAVPLAERTLQMREKAFPADHPDVATSLVDLARLYEFQDRSGEAEALSKRARSIYERALQMHKPIEVGGASSDVMDQTDAIDREVGRLTGDYIRDFGVAVSQIKLKRQVIDPPSRNSR